MQEKFMGYVVMKITTSLVLLLSTQTSFAEILPPYEEGVTYAYPFFYEDPIEDTADPASKEKTSKDKPPPAWSGNIGKAKVTVDVENPDFLSQCYERWESKRKKDKAERQETSRFHDEEEDYLPNFSASIKWSN